MKEKRIISEDEKDLLEKSKIKSFWSLGRLFYIMAILLPFLVCMIITKYYAYFYLFLVFLAFFLFLIIIWPIIFKRYLKLNDVYAFDSKILSCKKDDIYYYLVEIEGLDGNFIERKFPISKRLKNGTKFIVIMSMGEKNY